MKIITILLILFMIYILFKPPSNYVVPVSQIPAGTVWNSIAYGGGYYVAVGNNLQNGTPNIAYSIDGVNWAPGVPLPRGNWTSVTYGNGKFVAGSDNYNGLLGNGLRLYASDWKYFYSTTDPTSSWTPCNAIDYSVIPPLDLTGMQKDPIGMQINQITYGNGKFRTIGTIAGEFYSSLLSSDGINWSIDPSFTFPNTYKSIARGTDRFVAVSDFFNSSSRSVAVLVDGNNTWQLANSSANFTSDKIIYNSHTSTFWTNRDYYSTNGFDWTHDNYRDPYGLSIAANESGRMVKVESGRILYIKNVDSSSVNTSNPEQVATLNIDTRGTNWNAVFYVNGIYVAFSTSGNYSSAYSYDGMIWNAADTYVPPPDQSCDYVWIPLGNCVNGVQNYRLQVNSPSYGNGGACPGENGSGLTLPCNINPPPPPPPPPQPRVEDYRSILLFLLTIFITSSVYHRRW